MLHIHDVFVGVCIGFPVQIEPVFSISNTICNENLVLNSVLIWNQHPFVTFKLEELNEVYKTCSISSYHIVSTKGKGQIRFRELYKRNK